jgi:hypothetical protein
VKNLIWAFILGVALADVNFTWRCRQSVTEWESNPAASVIFEWQGVFGAALYRAVWLGYAAVLARFRTRLSWLITPVWGLGHAYLLIVLVQCYRYLPVLQN